MGCERPGRSGPATHTIWERAPQRAVREGDAVYDLKLSEVTSADAAGAGAPAGAARPGPATSGATSGATSEVASEVAMS